MCIVLRAPLSIRTELGERILVDIHGHLQLGYKIPYDLQRLDRMLPWLVVALTKDSEHARFI